MIECEHSKNNNSQNDAKNYLDIILDEKLTIGCKTDSIQIIEIQRQGKNRQTAKDFLLGKKISKGSILI